MTTRGSIARGQGAQQVFTGRVRKWRREWVVVDTTGQATSAKLLKWVAIDERFQDGDFPRFPLRMPLEKIDLTLRQMENETKGAEGDANGATGHTGEPQKIAGGVLLENQRIAIGTGATKNQTGKHVGVSTQAVGVCSMDDNTISNLQREMGEDPVADTTQAPVNVSASPDGHHGVKPCKENGPQAQGMSEAQTNIMQGLVSTQGASELESRNPPKKQKTDGSDCIDGKLPALNETGSTSINYASDGGTGGAVHNVPFESID